MLGGFSGKAFRAPLNSPLDFRAPVSMEYLYKYRSMSDDVRTYTGRIITDQELYFSHARSFNDPFDCLPAISLKATKDEFEEYLIGLFKRQSPRSTRAERMASVKAIIKDPKRNHKSTQALELLKQGLENAMNLAGVLSLSATDRHVLMWSHYANCHSGICLKFKASRSTPFFGEAQEVDYQTIRPVVNLIHDDPQTFTTKSLLTKADFWAYEKEWRMISPSRPPGVHKYPADLLVGVILGTNMSAENKDIVLNWISSQKRNIDIFQASINEQSFSLDINQI